ncbi:MAG: F0F1 ATP synthase subunit B [Gemmataceae bacterium]
MRTSIRGPALVVLSALVVLLLPGLGLAAEEHPPAKGDGGVFGFALDLGIWTLLVFLLLLAVLRKWAWGPMLEGLKKREENIFNALEDAKKARADAERVRAELQAEMDKASEKVREMLEEARRDATATKEDMLAKARAEINTEKDRARREIQIAEDHALHEIWNQAVELAAAISTKTIERSLTPEDHRKFVDEALKDLHKIRRPNVPQPA